MERRMKKPSVVRKGAPPKETASDNLVSRADRRSLKRSAPSDNALATTSDCFCSMPTAAEQNDEQRLEDGGSSPTITLLFSQPEMLSPGQGPPSPCVAEAGGSRVCDSFRPPPPPPPRRTSALEDATRAALEAIDFRSQVEALMKEDSEEESEVLTSEGEKPEEEMDSDDFTEPSVPKPYSDTDEVLPAVQAYEDYTHTTKECECHPDIEPIIWFPEEAQFQIFWDLLDPRASVRDIDEEEEGPVKNRRERAADFMRELVSYLKNASQEEDCLNLQSLDQHEIIEDIPEEIDWFNMPFSAIDGPLREKIYKKYTAKLAKDQEAIKCSREPMTRQMTHNLRKLQYRAARWLTKHLDNEYSFLPKKKKEKIIIPHDPTVEHHISDLIDEILLNVFNSEEDDFDLFGVQHPEDVNLTSDDETSTESDKLKREEDTRISSSLSISDYADSKSWDQSVSMESMDAQMEKSIKDLVVEIREDAILGYAGKTKSKRIVLGVLNSIIDGLGEEEKEEPKEEQKHEKKEEEKEVKYEDIEPSQLKSEESRSSLNLTSETMGIIQAKFHLDNGRCFSREYSVSIDFNDIRTDLSELCMVPEEMIVIEFEGKVLLSKHIIMKYTILEDIQPEGAEVMEFNLKSFDPLRYPLRTIQLTMEPLPVQVRFVDVEMDEYEKRLFRVTIVDDCIVKPFIGGFRNKSTGVEFHNAFSQTGPILKNVERTHRDTQTFLLKTTSMETVQHKQTQMWRRDCYITAEYDYLIPATPYLDADTFKELMKYEERAFKIQRFWKINKFWNLLKGLANKARECKHYEIQAEKQRLREISDRYRLDLVHKMYPRSKADFDMWYAMIEKWRVDEQEKLRRLRDSAGRRAGALKVHVRELELLRKMEARRARLMEERREKRELALVEACQRPVEWTAADGCVVSMDTLRTQRARDLARLYRALARPGASAEERMEALVQLKYALAPFPEVLPMRLTRLVEREGELLLRGLRRDDQIDLLHRRLLQLFLELLKEPQFNPEAAKRSLEHNVAGQRRTFHQCSRCARLKQKTGANINAATRSLQHCTMCEWVQHVGSRRHDMGPYRDLMRAIRRDEAKRQAYSSVAFVMRDADFFWLINLWHVESFLTEASDISAMRMPRWDARREWAPWNCILLTDDETKWHLRLRTLEEGYSQELMGDVHSRHVTARLHFRNLVNTDKKIREGCKWFDISRKKTYVAPSREADAFQGISESCPLPQCFDRPTASPPANK